MQKLNWQSKAPLIAVAVFGSFAILLGDLLISNYWSIANVTYGEKISALILFLTAVIVFWYAQESAKSNGLHLEELDAQIMPYLRLQWSSKKQEKDEDEVEIFQIVNDGNGIALDVQFSQIDFSEEGEENTFQIKSRPLIAPRGSSGIGSNELFEGLTESIMKGFYENESFLIKKEIQDKIKSGFEVKVHYKDIKKRPYKAVFVADETYNDKFRIKSQERKNEKK